MNTNRMMRSPSCCDRVIIVVCVGRPNGLVSTEDPSYCGDSL